MVRQAGLEPATNGLENRCSIQLSYWRLMVLMAGLEPARLCSRQILSLLCLPISPHERCFFIKFNVFKDFLRIPIVRLTENQFV
tara:strand:- start:796 stop:1047 length:252 start_codon:yes stop_codon:yes gene_type:complete